MNDFKITKELIQKAKDKYACQDGIKWLEKKERTWLELKSKSYEWAVWGMTFIKDIPIDLTGLDPFNRAYVMVKRLDCSIDLTGLTLFNRVYVMIKRPDCPIDLTGLSSDDRVKVMINRLDCPIDLTGLSSDNCAWVIEERGLKK